MARLRRGSPGLIRDLNRAATLAIIGDQGPIARAEITRRLTLSPATVTGVTRDLVAEGLVRVVDQAPSNGGRPALLLGLVGGAAHALGAKIAVDHLAIVRVDLEGEVLDRFERPFDVTDPGALDRLGNLLADAVARSGAGSPRLLGVGMGVPGIVDTQRGLVDAPVLGWEHLPLGPVMADRLGVPVLVDNDVNTLAVSERLYGRGRGVDHFLTVTIGRGVGLGIVIAGDVYRGARGGAGEFGHVRFVEDGPPCICGKTACLEALVADPALIREGRALGLSDGHGNGSADEVERLRALAEAGNPAARAIYERAGAILGRAVAGLVSVLNPQLVLVSGEGTLAWPLLAGAFDDALRHNAFGPLRDVAVEVDPWDDAKWARGAAALILRATFSAPLYERQAEDAVRARLGAPRPVSLGLAGRDGEPVTVTPRTS